MSNNSLEKIRNKIFTETETSKHLLDSWRKKEETLVFTNGCFDILHRGHIELLSKASDLGTRLIIGLNDDNSVRRLKGPERPVQDEHSRALILASLEFVDAVIFFKEDTPISLIEFIRPDVLVKGGDYSADEIVGYDFVTGNRGKVVILDFVKGFSSSSIMNRIK